MEGQQSSKLDEGAQYFKLLDLLDSELDRFYTQQNIYLGAQIAFLVAFLVGLDTLLTMTVARRMLLVLGIILGLGGAVTALRGVIVLESLFGVAKQLERESGASLVTRFLEQVKLSKEVPAMFRRLNLKAIVSSVLAVSFCCFWVLWLLIIEGCRD